MPTLTVTTIETPEGQFIVRCDQLRAFRPAPVDVVDKPAMEKRLRAHQTKHTRIDWMPGLASRPLAGMGFEEAS